MKPSTRFFIPYTLLLIFSSMLFRCLLLVFNVNSLPSVSSGNTLAYTLLIGLLFDIKWASLLLIVPIIILASLKWINKKWIITYTYFWIIISSIIVGFNVFYYQEWQQFFSQDSWQIIYHEGIKSHSISYFLYSILMAVFIAFILIKLFRHFIFKQIASLPSQKHHAYYLLFLIPIFILIFLGQNIFSNHSPIKFYNHLAQGPILTMLSKKTINEDWLNNKYIDMNVAVDNFYHLYTNKAHRSPLNITKYTDHIQLIITDEDIQMPISPFLSLSNLSYTPQTLERFLPALLNGYPPLPHISTMDYPEKLENLPSLIQSFHKKGFKTQLNISQSYNTPLLNDYIKYLNFDTDQTLMKEDSAATKTFTVSILDKENLDIWQANHKTLKKNSLYIPININNPKQKTRFYHTFIDTGIVSTHLYNIEDISVTLLNMFAIPTGAYIFSKDILSDSIPHFGLTIDENKAAYKDDTSFYEIKIDKPFKKAPVSPSQTSDYLLSILQMIQEDFRSK